MHVADQPNLQDYEHSNDEQLDTGHESAQPSAQAEIDYALHDAGAAPFPTLLLAD